MGDTIQPLAVSHPHPLTLINGVPISPAFSSQYLHFSARRLSRKPVLSPIRQAGSAGEFTPPQGRPPPQWRCGRFVNTCKYPSSRLLEECGCSMLRSRVPGRHAPFPGCLLPCLSSPERSPGVSFISKTDLQSHPRLRIWGTGSRSS